MASFIYFAYGSNMLAERLQTRCKSARAIGHAWVNGYQLVFHKISKDGSGKATLKKTNDAQSRIYGAVFSINSDEKDSLDRAEGAGYTCQEDFKVGCALTPVLEVITYFARPDATDNRLMPYDWYRDLVIAGARRNALPEDYIERLKSIPAATDLFSDRPERRSALRLLSSLETSS